MQRNDWQATVGTIWAEEVVRTDRSFGGLAPALDAAIRAAAPAGPFRALDIGCGAGATSLALADARPDARITGIDISPDLVAAGTARAGDHPNLDFVVGDAGADAAAYGPADLLFSRHGVMFFPDAQAGFAALHRAAAPGGRIVFSCFREVAANPWASLIAEAAGGTQEPGDPGTPGPFAFADPARVTPLLEAAGWREVACTSIEYRYVAGGGDDPVADALGFFRRIGPAARLIRELPDDARPAALARVEAVLAAHRHGDTVDFPAAAWIWTAAA
jgi:SAM-dependent methyltransferase